MRFYYYIVLRVRNSIEPETPLTPKRPTPRRKVKLLTEQNKEQLYLVSDFFFLASVGAFILLSLNSIRTWDKACSVMCSVRGVAWYTQTANWTTHQNMKSSTKLTSIESHSRYVYIILYSTKYILMYTCY